MAAQDFAALKPAYVAHLRSQRKVPEAQVNLRWGNFRKALLRKMKADGQRPWSSAEAQGAWATAYASYVASFHRRPFPAGGGHRLVRRDRPLSYAAWRVHAAPRALAVRRRFPAQEAVKTPVPAGDVNAWIGRTVPTQEHALFAKPRSEPWMAFGAYLKAHREGPGAGPKGPGAGPKGPGAGPQGSGAALQGADRGGVSKGRAGEVDVVALVTGKASQAEGASGPMAAVEAWRAHRASVPTVEARRKAVDAWVKKVPAHLWREVPLPPLPAAEVPRAYPWDVTTVYAPGRPEAPMAPSTRPVFTRQGQRLAAASRNALRYLLRVRRALREAVGARQRGSRRASPAPGGGGASGVGDEAWVRTMPEAFQAARVTDVTAWLRSLPGVAEARGAFLAKGAAKYDHQARFAYGMAALSKKHAAWREEKAKVDAYAQEVKAFLKAHPANTRRGNAMKGKLLRARLASQKALQGLSKAEDRLRATQFSVPKHRIAGYGKAPQKVLRALGAAEKGGGSRWFGHVGHRARVSEVYLPETLDALRKEGHTEEVGQVRWRKGEKESLLALRAPPRAYAQQVDTLRKRARLEGRILGRAAHAPPLRPQRDAGVTLPVRGVKVTWWPRRTLARAWLNRLRALYGEAAVARALAPGGTGLAGAASALPSLSAGGLPGPQPRGSLARQKARAGEKGNPALPLGPHGSQTQAQGAKGASRGPGAQGGRSLAQRLGVGPGSGPKGLGASLAEPGQEGGPWAPEERLIQGTRWVVEVPRRRDVETILRGRGKAGPRLASDHEGVRRLYQQLRVVYAMRRGTLDTWLARAGKADWWATVALVESRLEVVLWRAGFAPSVHAARRWVRLGWVLVNGRRAPSGSRLVKVGDTVGFVPEVRPVLHRRLKTAYVFGRLPPYLPPSLEVSWAGLEAVVCAIPTVWYLPFKHVDIARFQQEVRWRTTPVAAKARRRRARRSQGTRGRVGLAEARGLGRYVPRGKHAYGRWGKGGGAYHPPTVRAMDSVHLRAEGDA